MQAYKCLNKECGAEFIVTGVGMAFYLQEKHCPYCSSGIKVTCEHIKKYADFDWETMPIQTSWVCIKCGAEGVDFGVTSEDRKREKSKIRSLYSKE